MNKKEKSLPSRTSKRFVCDSSKDVQKSPRKQKSSCDSSPATPPKQKKTSRNDENFTPSDLLCNLDLFATPVKDNVVARRQLFSNCCQSARRALHGSVPTHLIGRENEIKELSNFIEECLRCKESGTLYISGPPGTGKTACLSLILRDSKFENHINNVYINCTAIKSPGAIYSKIVNELKIKSNGKTEKDNISAIENHLKKDHNMTLLVLDEIDQLDSKKQSVLYTIFEWPSKKNSKLILIGIANALDLTDRILPRLQAKCELKPTLMHFPPYTKQQIVQILTARLNDAKISEIFSPVAIQMLAAKVAAISGDIRRALDISRRVIELAEQHRNKSILLPIENDVNLNDSIQSVNLKEVVDVLNTVYGTSQNLNEDSNDTFPLQQKIILCGLLLILQKARNKDVTVGRLHDVYKRICAKRNLLAVDQGEFVGLCSLIETRGAIRIAGKKEPRLQKVSLNWDEEEVAATLKDKVLMSSILEDVGCLGKM